ncbi:hypothetical protein PENARI_c039G09415 [Penicillium arizonense]|uniref:C2H2-type domain-containing protein n=1 Tax=Penicillium arizonense TaxID=1835702 RepID=A0A1F5L3B3_PENAI|nr:hypothetical protein PENARI_c039G09415 [Penicillium arizonense]OGE47672.1 hypothetical protein PENARI_c039G09415 [Penicillium arizonense]
MRTATKLSQLSTLVAKKSAVEDILDAYNSHISDRKCLPFYFNRRAAVMLATDGVFSNNSVAPSLAYITFDKIQTLRKKHVYTPPYKRVNEIVNAPGLRIRQKRLDSLEPQNPAEDPYIVTILIALAQEQRRRRQQQEGSYFCVFCNNYFARSDNLRDHYAVCAERGDSGIPEWFTEVGSDTLVNYVP